MPSLQLSITRVAFVSQGGISPSARAFPGRPPVCRVWAGDDSGRERFPTTLGDRKRRLIEKYPTPAGFRTTTATRTRGSQPVDGTGSENNGESGRGVYTPYIVRTRAGAINHGPAKPRTTVVCLLFPARLIRRRYSPRSRARATVADVYDVPSSFTWPRSRGPANGGHRS